MAGWVGQTTWMHRIVTPNGDVEVLFRRQSSTLEKRSTAKAAAKVKVDPAIIPEQLNSNHREIPSSPIGGRAMV